MSLSTTILNIIAQIDAKMVYNSIMKYAYVPNTNSVDVNFGGSYELKQLINKIDYTQQLSQPMKTIYQWIQWMNEIIADLTACVFYL
jgi:hypothetical protein